MIAIVIVIQHKDKSNGKQLVSGLVIYIIYLQLSKTTSCLYKYILVLKRHFKWITSFISRYILYNSASTRNTKYAYTIQTPTIHLTMSGSGVFLVAAAEEICAVVTICHPSFPPNTFLLIVLLWERRAKSVTLINIQYQYII